MANSSYIALAFTPVDHPGNFNPLHKSNVTIVWTYATIPTPWPFLAASISLSFLTALWGFVSSGWHINFCCSRRKPGDPRDLSPNKFDHVSSVVTSCINTIRSVSATVGASRAYANNGARWIPPSALAVLLVAMLPSMVDRRAPTYWINRISICNCVMVFISMALMTAGALFRGGADFYGKFSFLGGTCPGIKTDGCPSTGFGYTGCKGDYGRDDSNELVNWGEYSSHEFPIPFVNMIATVEKFIGAAIFIPFILAFILAGRAAFVLLMGLFFEIIRAVARDVSGIEVNWAKNRRRLVVIYGVAVILIAMLGTASLTMHIMAFQYPYTFQVYDGHGPYDESQKHGIWGDDTSWSDCFNVSTPTDSVGFFNDWWTAQKASIEAVLAVV